MSSETDDTDLSDEELEAKREQLEHEVQEAAREDHEQTQSLLDAVSEDDDLANTDTATFGQIQVTYKEWIPGEKLQQIRRAKKAIDSGDTDAIQDRSDELDLLTELTVELRDNTADEIITDTDTIRAFWDGMFDRYGIDGIHVINDRMLGPILESTQEKGEALQSFQGDGQGDADGDGNGRDWKKRP
jgi:hypothetical protein